MGIILLNIALGGQKDFPSLFQRLIKGHDRLFTANIEMKTIFGKSTSPRSAMTRKGLILYHCPFLSQSCYLQSF